MALSLRPLNPDLFPPGAFQLPLKAGVCRVGRDSENDMQVSHASVSLQHALIEVNDDSSVEVVDCGSSNGTFVNGIRVVDRRTLSAGDLLRFAAAEFRVSADLKMDADSGASAGDATEAEQLAQSGAEAASLRAEKGTLSDRIAAQENTMDRLNREIEDGVRREQQLRNQLSETRHTLMDREGTIAALNCEITRRDGSLRQLGDQLRDLQVSYDQSLASRAAIEGELELCQAELAGAIGARDFAEATASSIVARLFWLSERLLGEWRNWFRDEGHGDVSVDHEVAFARVEGVATRIRRELDLIEPIWCEFGEGVQGELRRRCERLREEEEGLLAETESRRVELAGVLENLEQFREAVDTEVRRAQGLSRRGTEIEIPERFESMVIARDREQEIYRALIERLEVLDRLLTGYRGSRKLKEVVIELDDFRSRLAVIIESSGVQLFEVPVRTILTLKHRKEVQILSRKGWGTRQFTEYPFQPGEVIKVIRPGYRVGEGEYAVILRKVEVLIRGVDE
ncbi:MAG: FHA domain-containing protein [Verrucomicrobiales bacterium]|nr:FHA domain-containing protein [Verrucomicrobiales bacterium]